MDLANMYRLLCDDAEQIPPRDEGEVYALALITAAVFPAAHPTVQKMLDFRDDPLSWPSLTDEVLNLRAPDFWINTVKHNGRIFIKFGRQAVGDEVPRYPNNAYYLFDAGGKGFRSEVCAKLAVLCAYELARLGRPVPGHLEGQAVVERGSMQPYVDPDDRKQEPHSRLALYGAKLGPMMTVARDDLFVKIAELAGNPNLELSALQQIADAIPNRPVAHTGAVPLNLGNPVAALVDFGDDEDDDNGPLPKIVSAAERRLRLADAV